MASYQEILTQIEELKQQAQDARKQELAGAISEIKRLMAEFGITLEDLGDKPGRGKPRGAANAKYRDPESGKTWSGRGRRPGWLAQVEAQGKTLEDCRIA